MFWGLKSSNGLKYHTEDMYEGISEIDNPQELFIDGLGECTDEHVKIDNYFVFTTPQVLSLAGDTIKELTIGDKVRVSPTALMYCPNLKKINIHTDWIYANKVIGNCIVCCKEIIVACPNSELPTDGSATKIGFRVLSAFHEREEIVIPEGYEVLGGEVFYKCENLKKLTLPKSLWVIGKRAFDDCKNLKEVVYGGSKEEWDALMASEKVYCKLDESVTVRFLG